VTSVASLTGRNTKAGIAFGTGAAMVANALPAAAPVAPSLARALRIPLRLPCPGAVLTFDDGPHPAGTPAVLDALGVAGSAPATFFLVGEQVVRYPGLAAEIRDAGHEIGLHGYAHRPQLLLTPRQIRDDLERGSAAIAAATGIQPRLYRPPFGIFSLAGLAIVRRLGLVPLLWSRWGRDWAAHASARSIAERVVTGITPGDVVLLHDADHYSAPASWRRTADGLRIILATLSERKLDVLPSSVEPRL
jgi:peptidoglycan/xylan/chitin deacetylase (PgdA/CDA1 family)